MGGPHFSFWDIVCVSVCLCVSQDLLRPQMLEIDVYVDTWWGWSVSRSYGHMNSIWILTWWSVYSFEGSNTLGDYVHYQTQLFTTLDFDFESVMASWGNNLCILSQATDSLHSCASLNIPFCSHIIKYFKLKPIFHFFVSIWYFCQICLFGLSTWNKKDYVQAVSHYHKINPFSAIQVLFIWPSDCTLALYIFFLSHSVLVLLHFTFCLSLSFSLSPLPSLFSSLIWSVDTGESPWGRMLCILGAAAVHTFSSHRKSDVRFTGASLLDSHLCATGGFGFRRLSELSCD